MNSLFYIIQAIVFTVFFLTGVCFIIIPKKYYKNKEKRCTKEIIAEVTELQERVSSESYTKMYSPTYTFNYNGEDYSVNLNSYENVGVPQIGENVNIKINPYNPKDILIENNIVYKIFNILGIIFLAISISNSIFFIVIDYLVK